MTPPSEPAAPARWIHPTRPLARLLRRTAWSLSLGLTATALLLALSVYAAPRSSFTTVTWFASPSDNLCCCKRSWCRWAHSVTIEVQQFTELDDSPLPPRPLIRGTDAFQYPFDGIRPIEPRYPLGDGLSPTPTVSEVHAEGRWSETAYGWPLRCLRIRGWDAGVQSGRPGRAWTPKICAGRWPVALAALPTVITVGSLSGLAFLIRTAAAALRRARRARRNRCTSCGYPLPSTGLCPECGPASAPPASPA